MKINRINILAVLLSLCCHSIAEEAKPLPNAWDKDSRSVYDLMLAQMRNADADYGGSVDTLLKYAKSQKDDRLYAKAFASLLQTKRYAEAVNLIEEWQVHQPKDLSRFYVLALALDNRSDAALREIRQKLSTKRKYDGDGLNSYLRFLSQYWYHSGTLAVVEGLYKDHSDNKLLAVIMIKLLRWHGRIDEAVTVIDKQLFDEPKNIEIMHEKSETYRYALRLDEAEQVWKSALADYPLDEGIQFAYAKFLFDRYDFVGADRILNTIKPINDTQQMSVDKLKVMVKAQLGDYQAAENVFDWEKITPLVRDGLYYLLADVLLEAKQNDLALKYFEKIDPVSESGLAAALKIGRIKYEQSPDKGNAWLDNVKEQFHLGDDDFVQEKANVLEDAGDKQAAYDVLTAYLDNYPGNSDVRYLRSLISANMQDNVAAVEDLRHLHLASPDNMDVQNALGFTLLSVANGDEKLIAEAKRMIEKALFEQPSSPAIVDSMGWALYTEKDYQAALPYFRFAYSHFIDGEVIGHYIVVLEKLGHVSLAKQLYQLEMRYEPNREKIQFYTKDIQESLRQ